MEKVPYNFNDMTRVHWMGITILEPVTVLTNLLITAVCLFAFIRLRRLNAPNTIQKIMEYFFLLMGIATATGGILGHGFLYITGLYGKIPGWYISMFAIAFIERAAIIHSRPLMGSKLGNFFSLLNYVEVAVFMVLAFITLNFRFVEIHATYGLFIIVFCFELYTYSKVKDPGSRYIFVATLLAAIAAISNLLELSIHRWFTYNDLSHVFMAVAIYCYYKGAMNLKIYKNSEPNKVKAATIT